MVRLVSSRIHRCYSRRGAQRSARNEKLTNLAHILACTALIASQDLSFLQANKRNVNIPDAVAYFGILVLFSVHLIDIMAILVAHRMFYRLKKSSPKPQSLFTTPSKVDAIIASLFAAGTLFLTVATVPLSAKESSRWLSANLSTFAGFVLYSAAAIANLVLSLPSLDFKLPPSMARSHNLVSGLFLIGSLFQFQASAAQVFWDKTPVPHDTIQALFSFFSYVLVGLGAVLNGFRVSALLSKVHQWNRDGSRKDEIERKSGLLSWFKSSRSVDENTDTESDGIDEEEGDSADDAFDRHAASTGRTRRYKR